MRASRSEDNFLFFIKLLFCVFAAAFTFFAVLPKTEYLCKKTDDVLKIAEIAFSEKPIASETTSYAQDIVPVKNETETKTEVTPLPEAPQPEEYKTPDDIVQKQKDFVAAFSSDDIAGKVTESFFIKSGATDAVGNVYIRNTTQTKKPNFKDLMDTPPALSVTDTKKPVVLIYHTHTTESYLLVDDGYFYKGYETRSTDSDINMVRIGDEICKVLTRNGIGVIHDTAIYDGSYNGAYARSRAGISKILEENPTVEITLDVHRDAVYYSSDEHGKQAAEINGKKAAQIMIITGAQEGSITDYPDWEKNLTFALQLQKTAQQNFEGLMKPIYFCQRKYNMDITPCSLLLEVGSDANTLDEALYSAHLIGEALSELIIKNVKA